VAEARSTTTANDVLELTKSYSDMHELSRHINHMLETLKVAKNTISAIIADFRGQDDTLAMQANPELPKGPDSRVKFWAMFIANLEHRALSFNDRLENEISLVILRRSHLHIWLTLPQAYHLVNVLQLGQARELLEESRDEGKDIARYVAYASMIFLPGTFVSVSGSSLSGKLASHF